MHYSFLSLFTRFRNNSALGLLRFLSKRDRRLLGVVISISLILSFLDLLGVLLIGVIASLSITGLSATSRGDRVSTVLEVMRLDSLAFDTQVMIIGGIVAAALISKTLISFYLVKRSLFFMARRAAVVSSELLAKYFTIPVSKINQRSSQTSIYALTGGVNVAMVGVIGASVALISDMALLLVMGVGLFFVDSVTALSALVIFGSLSLFLYKNMHEKMRRIGEQQAKLEIESSQRIFEAISSYRELLVRNRRGYYARQIGDIRFKLADGQAHGSFMGSVTKYALEITLVIGALLLAVYQFSTSSAFRAIATISIFIAASTRLMPAILRLQSGLLSIKSSLAQARPTLILIEELSKIPLEPSVISKLSRLHEGFSAHVSLKNLSFEYLPGQEVIRQLDFKVHPGEFVAIVGSSGAGKTTLVDLMLGALEAKTGEIEIAGCSPREAFSKWPGSVAYVPQDSPIINGTIRENLGLGYPLQEVSDEICWASLKLARLKEFVETLPDKLDSFVGDRGTQLSGGQRQRLGIARALITSPRLLILDEATSALDGITESEISDSLRNIKTQTTLIIIAHRLSTITEADRVYFMDRGTIKGVGTFSELKSKIPEFLAQAELMGL